RQNVDTLAVAGNSTGVAPPWSMLALNPDCDPNPSGQVGGNGDVNVEGAVAVDSNCDGALLVNGNGHLSAPECDVVGTAQTAGSTDVASSTGADLNSRRVGSRVLDGSELSTGNWTNATSLEMAIVRGQDTDVPIGAHASGGSAGTTLTTPALSLTSTPTAS